MFSGSLVALVTPMHADGSLDISALRDLVAWHIEQGTQGIIAAGTTGEAAALTFLEYQQVVREVLLETRARVPVLAGTGTNSTQKTIELTQTAKELGVDACLILTPYCVKPTQAGLLLHYQKIADSVSIPQILYNAPGRTACDLLPETVKQLVGYANIVGIKECVSENNRYQTLVQYAADQMAVLSGDDATAYELLKVGGQGVISVTANVAPRLMRQFCDAMLAGDVELGHKLDKQLQALHQNLFLESNPIPVKWALHKMGLIPSGIRLPLTPLSVQYHTALNEALNVL
ncbi:MAG: 4-hydroxy-tetrahydrodipicolinate synthase [Legionellales bacterium]|jgi:4-hydroxy-tetrahydrodipicolinate synthase